MLSLGNAKITAMAVGALFLAGGGTVAVSQLVAQEKPVVGSTTPTRPATTQAATAPTQKSLDQVLDETGATEQQRARAREIVDRAAESWRVWFIEHREELEKWHRQYEEAAKTGDKEKGELAGKKQIAVDSTISPRGSSRGSAGGAQASDPTGILVATGGYERPATCVWG